ncbi:MAG: Uncharacterised protein [Glaciecola sp. HTCC2999]|nr:MAG: Uncharacterised protein [Glaciecola sp. HTCC2999]
MKRQLSHSIHLVSYIMLVTLLSGCSTSIQDLKQFTTAVKSSTPITVGAISEFLTLPDYEYQSLHLRSPFENAKQPEIQINGNQSKNCLTPNTSRHTSPLETYAIDSISMSGVMLINNTSIALFKTQDGQLHQARVGHYLGLFNGQITDIEVDHVVITQMIPDGSGCYQREEMFLLFTMDADEEKHA